MKICSSCKIAQNFSEFHKDKYSKDGYKTICKKCRKVISLSTSKQLHKERKIFDRNVNNSIYRSIKLNKSGKGEFYGLGRWTRGNTEPCFIAVKGKPKRVSASVFQIIKSKLNGHSRKPNIVRNKIIELIGDLPRIELFARERIEGWDAWGNEVPNEEQKELKLQKLEGLK